MTGFYKAARVSAIADGGMIKVSINGRGILLARVRDRFFATDAACPHLGADLTEGTLAETILTCPLHHSRFDLVDGRVVRWTDLSGKILTAASRSRPPRPLRIYPVRVDGDSVFVGIGDPSG